MKAAVLDGPFYPLQLCSWAIVLGCAFLRTADSWGRMLDQHKGIVNLEQLDQLVWDYIDKEQLAEVRFFCLLPPWCR